MKLVKVVANSPGGRGFFSSVAGLFQNAGFTIWEEGIPDSEVHLVCWTGGSDINPKLYRQACNKYTNFSPDRDEAEVSEYRKWKLSTPKVGICRGGQLLNVLSGGSMWQHVDGHGRGNHVCIHQKDGKEHIVSSVHHQMMRIGDGGYLIGASQEASYKMGADDKRIRPQLNEKDPEVIFYPETQSLCFQPHPEFGPQSCEDYFFDLLEKSFPYLGKEKPKVSAGKINKSIFTSSFDQAMRAQPVIMQAANIPPAPVNAVVNENWWRLQDDQMNDEEQEQRLRAALDEAQQLRVELDAEEEIPGQL